MNEELISKVCELIEIGKGLLVMIGVALAMCLSSVTGSAIYDFVTKRDGRKKGKNEDEK